MKSAKDKAMKAVQAGLNEYQKANHRADTHISIELKEIDGEKKLVARCNGFNDGMVVAAIGEVAKAPLAKEFTDIDKFAEYVAEEVRAAGKELLA